ncbi:Ribonuclease BN, tRNA processing enzyme [Streptomyces zhaozhouensis]|uniref:Ribonuclease BN, tRNA processing enzyme n=1 Tax=Streptomyces zhaozhouensis TaxID=1300267 RepID=A0A286E2A6_9ACTN|nr:MBL fold metallo-hydrolase [Streptomyces zhaozhouensis]SOD65048.1 Ribonuclease BN, tRNA processing enzyme [Streptomyces zhaozhouensis]
MKLTVVGCSGSFPAPDSACSSYLIEAEGYRLLLDMGNGALGELQKHCGLYDIDAIALSHLHPDHCIDMCGYFVARYYRHDGGRPPRVPVYGPSGTEQRLITAYDDVPDESSMREVFDFHDLETGRDLVLGPLTVRAARVNHPVETYGFRVEYAGRSICYSGDTGSCEGLDELARGVDLFLCEASFTQGKEYAPDVHLNGLEAGVCAQRAGADRLVLTHVPPWTDAQVNLRDAKSAFDGPVELARPGAVYVV